MDRSRHDKRSDPWRKRTGARRRRALLLASAPKRLVFITVAATAALVTQFVTHNSGSVPEINLQNLIKPRPIAIAGVASVIDGDTIEVHGQRVRFNGIDAPESHQYCNDAKGFEYPCGRRSAEALDGFLAASRPVQCIFVTWDRYGRFVGDCRRADGASVAAWMVEHGQALDWPRYSRGAYAAQQSKAEAAKIGLWVGTFEAPWDWRASHADGAAPPSSQRLGIVSRPLVAQSGYSCDPRRYCSQIGAGLPVLNMTDDLSVGERGTFVFPGTVEGKPLVGFPKYWKKVLKGTTLEGITPHVLRHSFASIANDLGFTEATVASLLGHSRGTVTSRYIHTVDTALIMAADTIAGYINGLLDGVHFTRTSYALDRPVREAALSRLFSEVVVDEDAVVEALAA
ncbi:tyrosine-type recombinase/integrase [Mesorhizobium cantuariense]|uniref:Tyrosine-type recombinase/integrase n=1 Tax=Mesorhizobium cantuariense TaxID=1300275 RepID=A0ABV7MIY7_9HYPH